MSDYAQTGYESAKVGAPLPEIHRAHAQLDEVVSSIADRINHLEEKLGAVLHPATPPPPTSPGPDSPGSGVQLADELFTQTLRLRGLHERLVQLTERIAL